MTYKISRWCKCGGRCKVILEGENWNLVFINTGEIVFQQVISDNTNHNNFKNVWLKDEPVFDKSKPIAYYQSIVNIILVHR